MTKRAPKNGVSVEGLAAAARQQYRYDQETGRLFFRVRVANRHAGSEAGTTCPTTGYRMVSLLNRRYTAHRLAFLMMTGRWPIETDHRNGVRDDNRWSNLRECTRPENHQNVRKPSHNKSGYIGVHWCRQYGRWHAKIVANGKKKHLGSFRDPAAASRAYLTAKRELHSFQPTPRSAA